MGNEYVEGSRMGPPNPSRTNGESSEATHTEEIPEQVREGLKYWREDDEEKLEASRLPESESVQLESVLISECYPPSHADKLHSAIETMGWHETTLGGDRDVLEWVDEARKRQHGAGWTNLGSIRPSEDPGLAHLTADLPAPVSYATAGIYHILPSTSVLVMMFRLTDEAACKVEEPFRTQYQTTVEPSRLGWRYMSPVQKRKAEFQRIRRDYVTTCSDWLSDRVPGFFASEIPEDRFPHAEVLIFEEAEPLQGRRRKLPQDHYLQVMGLDLDFSTYAREGSESLLLRTPRGRDQSPLGLLLTGRREDLEKDLGHSTDDEPPSVVVSRVVATDLGGSFAVWSLGGVLRGFEIEVSKIRDRFAGIDTGAEEDIQALTSMRRRLLSTSQDLLPFATEFRGFCQSENRFRHWVETLHPVSRTAEKLDLPPLFEDLRQVWTERTTDILSFEKSLRDLAVTAASTAATESQHELSASSHKLQRRVGRFTAVLVVLAVIQTLILADLSWVEILSRTAWFLFSLPW